MIDFDKIDRVNSLKYFFLNENAIKDHIQLQSNGIKKSLRDEITGLEEKAKIILKSMKSLSDEIGIVPKRNFENDELLLKSLAYPDSVVFGNLSISDKAQKFNNNLSKLIDIFQYRNKLEVVEKLVKPNVKIKLSKEILEKLNL